MKLIELRVIVACEDGANANGQELADLVVDCLMEADNLVESVHASPVHEETIVTPDPMDREDDLDGFDSWQTEANGHIDRLLSSYERVQVWAGPPRETP